MKKRKIIGLLLSISLCMSSCLIVQAEDYVGPEYNENGFLMSPDELNADKPESTFKRSAFNCSCILFSIAVSMFARLQSAS